MARTARVTVGSREIKTRFGTYLDMARHGTIITVTDHGKPVAQLVPMPEEPADADEAALRRMAAAGELTRATRPPRQLHEWPPPLYAPGKPLSEIIVEDREDRF